MINNKRVQQGLKDSRLDDQQGQWKDKKRDPSVDDHRDTSRKQDKTAHSRKDNLGKK